MANKNKEPKSQFENVCLGEGRNFAFKENGKLYCQFTHRKFKYIDKKLEFCNYVGEFDEKKGCCECKFRYDGELI